MIKATRNWGGLSSQGKAFGFLEGGRGAVAASIGALGIFIFARIYIKMSKKLYCFIHKKQLTRRLLISTTQPFVKVNCSETKHCVF